MASRVKMKWPPVLCIWQDSATDHGWDESDKEPGDNVIRTLGFLVHQTYGGKGFYRIAHSEDSNYVNGTIDIPKVCVLKMHHLVEIHPMLEAARR